MPESAPATPRSDGAKAKAKPDKNARRAAKAKAKSNTKLKKSADDSDDEDGGVMTPTSPKALKEVEKQDHTDFDVGTSGAALTVPIDGKDMKVNTTYMLIKDNPCKLISLNKSAPGKHGHAKYALTGIHIFTGKKCETAGESHGFYEVVFKKSEFQLVCIDNQSVSVLLNDKPKDDLNLPNDTEDDEILSAELTKAFEDGKQILVSVLEAMGKEKIIGWKEMK